MPWEHRGPNKYYYSAHRVGRRVVKTYLGTASDPVAQILGCLDLLHSADRWASKDASRDEMLRYAEAESELVAAEEEVDQLLQLHRLSAGNRRPRRGNALGQGRRGMTARKQPRSKDLPTRDAFEELAERADAGDRDAQKRLRVMLRKHPQIWKRGGDLVGHAQKRLIGLIAGKSVMVRETLKCQVASMRSELAGAAPSPLKHILVEHVIATWLDLQHNQLAFAEPREKRSDQRFWEQRLNRAQQRHLAAVGALDELQKAGSETAAKASENAAESRAETRA
jgi:hypothetical protein